MRSLSGTWTSETLGRGNITNDSDFVKLTFPSPLGTRNSARLRFITRRGNTHRGG